MSNQPRLALLIDAENLNSSCADELMRHSSKSGQPIIRRAYGHVDHAHGWTSVAGLRFVHVNSAKNAADMALCIEALDLFHRGLADAFAIASSDSDFLHLALYLREQGVPVHGFGGVTTKPETRAAYSSFTELGGEVAPVQRKSTIKAELTEMIRQNGGALKLARINELMRRARPDFKISQHPTTKTWRSFIAAHPAAFKIDGSGADPSVRTL